MTTSERRPPKRERRNHIYLINPGFNFPRITVNEYGGSEIGVASNDVMVLCSGSSALIG